MNFEHVKVVITPSDDAPLAIMNWITTGRGDTLPRGARWVIPGWWTRPPLPELIQLTVNKTFADRPTPKGWKIVADADVPTDRTYRNAWVHDEKTGKVVHDMQKARALHRHALRNQRVEAMLLLDYDRMAAERSKNQVAVDAVDARKQRLLDVTKDPRIDAATTIEELKAVTLPAKE